MGYLFIFFFESLSPRLCPLHSVPAHSSACEFNSVPAVSPMWWRGSVSGSSNGFLRFATADTGVNEFATGHSRATQQSPEAFWAVKNRRNGQSNGPPAHQNTMVNAAGPLRTQNETQRVPHVTQRLTQRISPNYRECSDALPKAE